ncbi:redoxin domain-containing protein [Staphylococcus aureus]
MSLINKEILPFTAQAFDPKKDQFKEVTQEDLSTDTHFVHKAWHDHSDAISKITYTMIGDPSQTITRNFDVLDEATGLAQRGTFIIDPDGVVQASEINADGIGRDASTLAHKIKAAQYVRKNPGEVCPAKWEEGAKTLQPGLDLVGKI